MCEIKVIVTATAKINPDETIKVFPVLLQDLYARLVEVFIENGETESYAKAYVFKLIYESVQRVIEEKKSRRKGEGSECLML